MRNVTVAGTNEYITPHEGENPNNAPDWDYGVDDDTEDNSVAWPTETVDAGDDGDDSSSKSSKKKSSCGKGCKM